MGDYADMAASHLSHDADTVRAAIGAFDAVGATEFMLVPATDDLDDIERLAEIARQVERAASRCRPVRQVPRSGHLACGE
jgi:hypothetical protein